MSALNESHVEDAALAWLSQPGYAVGHGASFAMLRKAKPSLAPGEAAAERNRSAAQPERSGDRRRQMDEVNSFGEVVLVGRSREAIRRLNPAISQAARAIHKESLLVQIERRQNP